MPRNSLLSEGSSPIPNVRRKPDSSREHQEVLQLHLVLHLRLAQWLQATGRPPVRTVGRFFQLGSAQLRSSAPGWLELFFGGPGGGPCPAGKIVLAVWTPPGVGWGRVPFDLRKPLVPEWVVQQEKCRRGKHFCVRDDCIVGWWWWWFSNLAEQLQRSQPPFPAGWTRFPQPGLIVHVCLLLCAPQFGWSLFPGHPEHSNGFYHTFDLV